MRTEDRLRRTVTAMAAAIAVTVVLAIPVGYLWIGYQYESRALQLEAEMISQAISEMIYERPKMWRFEEHRLIELLAKLGHRDQPQWREVSDDQGNVAAHLGSAIRKPRLSRRAELHNGEIRVGSIEVTESFAPLVIETLVAGSFAGLLGIAVFAVLRLLPFRALVRAMHSIEVSQHTLHKEVLAKEEALRHAEGTADAMRHQALHDDLTTLPNRTLLNDRLQQALLEREYEKRPLALLVMDLDRFKDVNDTLGHHIGDLMLQEVGRRLKRVVYETDTVARLGGDEFGVLLPKITDREAAVGVAKKLLEAVEQPFAVEDQVLDVAASLGIALFPQHGANAQTLMRRADVAMYTAKRAKTGPAVYDPAIDRHQVDRLSIVRELRNAIKHDELTLDFQPQIDLKSARVVCIEALVRWEHPERGRIFPDQFIPLAEQSGLIKPLTLWVLNAALKQSRSLSGAGQHVGVAVNISASSLHDPELADQIAALLKAHGVEATRLELEITENAIMVEQARALDTLMTLNRLGISLTVDDFGTGYSSLAYLKELPVARIKIDKSFVLHMMGNDNDTVIVRSTIDLGHNLGLKVVAEGIENEPLLRCLTALGCDFGQGYWISKPIAGSDLIGWLGTSPWAVGASGGEPPATLRRPPLHKRAA